MKKLIFLICDGSLAALVPTYLPFIGRYSTYLPTFVGSNTSKQINSQGTNKENKKTHMGPRGDATTLRRITTRFTRNVTYNVGQSIGDSIDLQSV